METNKQIPAELQQLLDAAAKQLAGVQVTPELVTKNLEQNLEEGKKTTMKITKEKLKELAAEIIAEDGGELKEFFGFFGDSSTVKSLNGLVQAIAQDEKKMKQAIAAVKQAKEDYTEPEKHLSAIAGHGGNIKSRMETYAEMSKTAAPKEWGKHKQHKKVQALRRESDYVSALVSVRQQDVPDAVERQADSIDHTIESYNRSIRAAFKDMDSQSATASKIKYDPRYQDPLVTRLHTGRDPMARHMRENKMKITKANIKQLVAESIRDIFNENVDSPELGSETVAEQLPSNEPLEALPDMKGIAKSVDEALELLLRKRILAALHHGGAKQGTELYELASNTLNALDKLRTAIRDEASKR